MSSNQQMLAAMKGGTGAGQALLTSSGTWICPSGVTSISVVCVGYGGPNGFSAGSGGGALAYANNIPVVPGNGYPVVLVSGDNGYTSFNTSIVKAGNGKSQTGYSPSFIGGVGGTVINGTGGNGGSGGNATAGSYGGSGGAGGYSGGGGAGGDSSPSSGTSGSGGGGGGAAGVNDTGYGHPGGGVGVLGSGVSGSGGVWYGSINGLAGSGGYSNQYGGGGGGVGVVRIIWPGNLRQFPSTRTADE